MSTTRIDRRFRGPPDSGNGGYFAGLLARELGGSDVVVTLKQPAPLDVDLSIEPEGDKLALRAGDEVLATAERDELEIDVPGPTGLRAAMHAPIRAVARVIRLEQDDVEQGGPIRTSAAFESFATEDDHASLLRRVASGRFNRAA